MPSRLFLNRWLNGSSPGGKPSKPPAVDEENVEPAVVVVIVESDAAARGLEQVLVLMLAAENCFGVQAGFLGDVDEGDAEIGGRRIRGGCSWPNDRKGRASDRTSESVSTTAERQSDLRNLRRDCDK